VILTCRKIEEGPLENYMHAASLIHKLNLLMLEIDNVKQLKNILRIVVTTNLVEAVVDFIMSTDNFAHFGIRFLEIISIEFPQKVLESEVLPIVLGLLRTNDYETIV
jgi:hypothetical protein